MKYTKETKGKVNIHNLFFSNTNDLVEFFNNAPVKAPFNENTGSHDTSAWAIESFYGTNNWEEAIDLLVHGDKKNSQIITSKMKPILGTQNKSKRAFYDVVGYQASTARYLQGIPTSMINSKASPKKQKVVTLVKSITISGDVGAEKIIESSLKVLSMINTIEAQGFRVNLDLIAGSEDEYDKVFTRYRIKSADERLNISKIAFQLVNPSMPRRINFAVKERLSFRNSSYWATGYGRAMTNKEQFKNFPGILKEGEYFIPSIVNNVDQLIEEMKLA